MGRMDIVPRLDGMLHLSYILCFPDSSSTSAKFRKDLANQHCLNIGGMFKKKHETHPMVLWEDPKHLSNTGSEIEIEFIKFRRTFQNPQLQFSSFPFRGSLAWLGGGFKDFWGFHPETKMTIIWGSNAMWALFSRAMCLHQIARW